MINHIISHMISHVIFLIFVTFKNQSKFKTAVKNSYESNSHILLTKKTGIICLKIYSNVEIIHKLKIVKLFGTGLM